MGNLCFTLDTHEFLIRILKCKDEIMIFSNISPPFGYAS